VIKPIVSDIPGMAPVISDNVANPWGIVRNPDSDEFWVAQNEAGFLTLLNSDGTTVLNVTIPVSSSSMGATGSPSGVVTVPLTLQEEKAFPVGITGTTGSAQVLTVTEDGLICGFNQTSLSSNNNIAITIKDNSSSNAVYKGCAISDAGRFYACNFSSGRIEVYDTKWNLSTTISDSVMIALGYSPFNVIIHHNAMYVTFALQSGTDHSLDITGEGNGFVLVYDLNGMLLKRLISRGVLNSPWGMTIFQKHIFIANSGDGVINVFDRCSGKYIGTILSRCRVPIVIEGLKGILLEQQKATLLCKSKCEPCKKGFWFTAGINHDTSGLIGRAIRFR
jgi:uncharacterized protein (TIGR03118 family)